jgi:ribosomal-protein-alanine N-acetyltransferase
MTSGRNADPAIAISEAGPAAAKLIAALTENGAGEPWSVETVARLLGLPGCFALIAELNGTPTGFILVQVAADESEILNFAVVEQCRGKGMGRALLTAAIARAGNLGASAMFLEVACDNPAALRLYREQGFIQVGIRPDYYRRAPDDFTDALILRRNLITTVGTPH